MCDPRGDHWREEVALFSKRDKMLVMLNTPEKILPLLVCPPGCDTGRFQRAKVILARVWAGAVSASMSCIEYEEPEATWISQQTRALLDAQKDPS